MFQDTSYGNDHSNNPLGRLPTAQTSGVEGILEILKAWKSNSASIHLIHITLKPINYLKDIGDVISFLKRMLKNTKGVDPELIFHVRPTELVILSQENETTFGVLVTEVRMLLVRLMREYTPQAFFSVSQEQLIAVYNAGRHSQQVADLLHRLEREQSEATTTDQDARSLEPDDIESVVGHISNMPADQFVESFLVTQPVTRIRHDNMANVLFNEYYVSMERLQQTFLNGINPFLNMTTFKMLTTELDKQVLSLINNDHINPKGRSFNFNLETVLSSPFETLGEGGRAKDMIVEFRTTDVVSDFDRFQLARKQLRQYGAHIAIDCVVPDMMDILNFERLDCDIVKVQADRDLRRIDNVAENVRRVKEAGTRVIASRVESLDSIWQGVRLGIERFQGFYVDKLLRSSHERDQFYLG